MADPTTLTITLNLDDHLARHLGYDEDGDVVQEPMTVEDLVLDLAAQRLIDQLLGGTRYGAKDEPLGALRSMLIDRSEALATERVEDHVTAAFSQLIHETSEDGSEVFSHTLREAIVKATSEATKLRSPDKRRDTFSRERSVIEELVHEHVDRAVEREVKAEIDKAREAARAEVARRASEAIAEALAPKGR